MKHFGQREHFPTRAHSGPGKCIVLPDSFEASPLCAFCQRSGWKDLRDGVRFRYCQHRHVGATYDTHADKWEAHGPVTEAEWLEVLNVMDARLEAGFRGGSQAGIGTQWHD